MTEINFTLDTADIDRAIREVRDYRDRFVRRVARLRELIGERVAWSASRGFSTALVDDVIRGAGTANDVTVTVEHTDNLTVVFTSGRQAVFIEFGAGVYNNGAAGTSPHPWGTQFGYTIGDYGQGKGRRNVWGYIDESGGVTLTHGTPAAMPMYRGVQDAIRVIDQLVREVFGA